MSLNNLGVLLFQQGAYPEAEPRVPRGARDQPPQLGERHPRTAETLQNLAQVPSSQRAVWPRRSHSTAGRSRPSGKTLGNANPSVTINLNNLGELLMQTGRLDEAETLVREALALDRRMFGDPHSFVAAGLGNLATVLKLKGEFAEAERHYLEALAIDRSAVRRGAPRPSRWTSTVWATCAGCWATTRGRSLLPRGGGPARGHAGRRPHQHDRRRVQPRPGARGPGKAAEAERCCGAPRPSWTAPARSIGLVVNARPASGWRCWTRDARPRRGTCSRRAAVLGARAVGAEHVRTADARLALGRALLATREYARAEPVLRAAAARSSSSGRRSRIFAAQAAAALAELRRPPRIDRAAGRGRSG